MTFSKRGLESCNREIRKKITPPKEDKRFYENLEHEKSLDGLRYNDLSLKSVLLYFFFK